MKVNAEFAAVEHAPDGQGEFKEFGSIDELQARSTSLSEKLI